MPPATAIPTIPIPSSAASGIVQVKDVWNNNVLIDNKGKRAEMKHCPSSTKKAISHSDTFFKTEFAAIDHIEEDCVFVSAFFGGADKPPPVTIGSTS